MHQSSEMVLKHRIDEFSEVLDKDEFTVRDFEKPSVAGKGIVKVLREAGAITSQGREKVDGRNKPINKWEWDDEQLRSELVQYFKKRKELPCGHRGHVPPERDSNGQYLCKWCESAYSEETIKNSL